MQMKKKIYTFDYGSQMVAMTKILVHEFVDAIDDKKCNKLGPGRGNMNVQQFLVSDAERAKLGELRWEVVRVRTVSENVSRFSLHHSI